MAEASAQERSEQATPERLKKAREEGQIPQSAEVPSALVIVAFLISLAISGDQLGKFMISQFQHGLLFRFKPMEDGAMIAALHASAVNCLMQLLPLFMAACVASALGSVLASGWNVSFKTLSLKLENLSPIKGFKNLFTLKSLVQLPNSLSKLAIISIIVGLYMENRMDQILALQWCSTGQIVSQITSLALGVCARIAVGLAVLALADLLYRRWQHKRDLKMTQQEVREERKRYEMPAEIKSRLRGIQLSLTKKRMLQKVKTADVIVTNPTHYAIALKYDGTTMAAPQVVAKGVDFMAAQIRELAAKHNVPIVQRPELARTLYATVELDQNVPENLFTAVAEILALIHRMRKRRRGGSRA